MILLPIVLRCIFTKQEGQIIMQFLSLLQVSWGYLRFKDNLTHEVDAFKLNKAQAALLNGLDLVLL